MEMSECLRDSGCVHLPQHPSRPSSSRERACLRYDQTLSTSPPCPCNPSSPAASESPTNRRCWDHDRRSPAFLRRHRRWRLRERRRDYYVTMQREEFCLTLRWFVPTLPPAPRHL